MLAITKRLSFVLTIFVGLTASGKHDSARARTHAGKFAMTDGASNRCLTDAGYALGNPRPMTAHPWAAIPSQEWAPLLVPNGYHAIRHVQTTNLLEAANHFGPPDGFVDEGGWNASHAQMWHLYPFGKNLCASVNLQTGQMLTDPNVVGVGVGGSGKAAAPKSWTGNLNQWWHLYFLRK